MKMSYATVRKWLVCLTLAPAVLVLSGCSPHDLCLDLGLCNEVIAPLTLDVVIDASPMSPGSDIGKVRDTFATACTEVGLRTGMVRAHLLGSDVATTRMVWSKTARAPADTSKQGRDAAALAFANECLREVEPLIPAWVHSAPDGSPILGGSTRAATTSAPPGEHWLWLISDLREETRVPVPRHFECGPLPSDTQDFITKLRSEGVFPSQSLQGMTVYFLYAQVTPSGSGCAQGLARFDRLKAIFSAVVSGASGVPVFLSDGVTPEYFRPGRSFLIPSFLFLPWALFRSTRIKWKAWQDKRRGVCKPIDAILMVQKIPPRYDPRKNPTHGKWQEDLEQATATAILASDEVRLYSDNLAGQWPMWLVVAASIVFIAIDTFGNIVLIKDTMSLDPASRFWTALGVAATVILVTGWLRAEAVKHAKGAAND